MILDLNRYPAKAFRSEARETAKLALPMMLAQIAAVGVGFVDTVMAGKSGSSDLAAVALGSSIFSTVLITWIGVMTVLNPVIAQLWGEGKRREIGETGRQGLWFGLILGVTGMILILSMIAPLTFFLHMPEAVETGLAEYLFWTALAMPSAMIHRALHAYASSLNRPKPIMWISWAALLLNIPLNYMFVYGYFGMPALGGAGCGLASMLVFWFNAGALWLYIKKQTFFAPFGLHGGYSRPDKIMLKQLWKLGWPIGFSYFLEVSLFSFIVLLIAKFGAVGVAAQQIVISLTGIIYMIPQALGAAATVRIGHALGGGDYRLARYISGVAVACGLGLAVLTMLFLIVMRRPLAGLFTDDAAIAALAAKVLLFAALFQFFDFTQCIASYALRGYKLTRAPMVVHAVAFWGLGLLPGWYLADRWNMGIFGFWTALILSLASAAALLLRLLEKHSKAQVRYKETLSCKSEKMST